MQFFPKPYTHHVHKTCLFTFVCSRHSQVVLKGKQKKAPFKPGGGMPEARKQLPTRCEVTEILEEFFMTWVCLKMRYTWYTHQNNQKHNFKSGKS